MKNYKLILIAIVSLLSVIYLNKTSEKAIINEVAISDNQPKKNNTTTYNIPDTTLTFRVLDTYIKTDNSKTAGMQSAVTPALNLVNKHTNNTEISKDRSKLTAVDTFITIYVEKTDLKPVEWLSQNVTFQGQNFDAKEVDYKEIRINDKIFTITHTSCCGGYTPTYIYEYHNNQNEPVLIIFTTNAQLDAKDNREDGNYLLDSIVSSIVINSNN